MKVNMDECHKTSPRLLSLSTPDSKITSKTGLTEKKMTIK